MNLSSFYLFSIKATGYSDTLLVSERYRKSSDEIDKLIQHSGFGICYGGIGETLVELSKYSSSQ